MKMEQTECSETLAYKIQTPGNYPEENIQHSKHSESLKSRTWHIFSNVTGMTDNSTHMLPLFKLNDEEALL
jgi:hypothetical protein